MFDWYEKKIGRYETKMTYKKIAHTLSNALIILSSEESGHLYSLIHNSILACIEQQLISEKLMFKWLKCKEKRLHKCIKELCKFIRYCKINNIYPTIHQTIDLIKVIY